MDENNKKQGSEELEQEQKEAEACPSIFDKPDPDRYRKTEKAPKKGNRQVRNIVIALVLCVTLVISTTGISYLLYDKDPISFLKEYFAGEPEESSSDTQSQEPENLIFDYSFYGDDSKDTETAALGGIETITVVNEKDSYSLHSHWTKSTHIDPETYEEKETDVLNWLITDVVGKDIEGVKFSTTLVGFIVMDLLRIPYDSVYAENGNDQIPQGGMTYFEECGLKDAKNRCTVQFKNGAKFTVVVGDATPTGDFRFLSVENDDGGQPDVLGAPKKDTRIYKVPAETVTYYLKEAMYYIDKEFVHYVEQDESTYNEETGDEIEDPYFISGELSKFDALSMTGSNYAKDFVFEMVEEDQPGYDSIYLMTSPFTQNVDLDAISDLLSPVSDGLTANNCLVMKATNADLAKYGLDKPACQVRYVVKGEETVLKIGKQVDAKTDTYAVAVNGNASVFEVSASVIPFVNYTTADFASDTLYSCDITLIDTLQIQTKGQNELYRLKHGTDDTGKATLTVTTREGKVIDTEKFRSMYVDLLSLTSFTNVTDGKDAANPYVTITLTYDDYPKTDVIRLSPYTDRRYFMSLNGMGSTVVLSNSVDTFVASFFELL